METAKKTFLIFLIANFISISAFTQDKPLEVKPEENNKKTDEQIKIQEDKIEIKEIIKKEEHRKDTSDKPIGKYDKPIENKSDQNINEKTTKIIEKPVTNKSEVKNNNTGKLFIILAGFGGMSISGGEISGNGNQQINVGGSYGAFLNVGYYLFENGGIYLGLEYAGKETVIKRTFLTKPMINTFTFQFMELFLGYRGEFKWFFFSAGFYYGFKIAPWTEVVNLDGSPTTTVISSAYPASCHDEFGIQIAVGTTIKITRFLNIDVSISYETSFINAYDYIDKLRTNLICINAGATFKIDLSKKN